MIVNIMQQADRAEGNMDNDGMREKAVREPKWHGSVSVDWLDEERSAMVMSFEGDWSWTDAFWGVVRIGYAMEKAAHPIDVIFDLTRSGRFPEILWHFSSKSWVWHRRYWSKNSNRLVVVDGGRQMYELMELRRTIAPATLRYFRHVKTFEEALDLLKTWTLEEDSPTQNPGSPM